MNVTVVHQTVAITAHHSQFRKAIERESNVGYEMLDSGQRGTTGSLQHYRIMTHSYQALGMAVQMG